MPFVAGPDNHDIFLCGKANRPYLLLPDGKNHDFFYKFPNRAEPVHKEGYIFNEADLPIQDAMDSQFNEVALDYNAGFTASLAWLCTKGLSAGKALPDAQFPPQDVRNDLIDLRDTDQEFFVSASLLADSENGTELEATVWNRSRWPSRPTNELSFRYYFTHEGTVTATLQDADRAKISSVQTDPKGHRYVEVSWPGDPIYPGDSKTNSRRVRLSLSASSWQWGDDWSHATLEQTQRLIPHLPVYQASKLMGGEEPK